MLFSYKHSNKRPSAPVGFRYLLFFLFKAFSLYTVQVIVDDLLLFYIVLDSSKLTSFAILRFSLDPSKIKQALRFLE